MVYGTKAIIPAEVVLESARVQAYYPINNEVQRRTELDLVEERRERA